MNDREQFEAALQLFATLQPIADYAPEADVLVEHLMAMVGVFPADDEGPVEVPVPTLKQIVH